MRLRIIPGEKGRLPRDFACFRGAAPPGGGAVSLTYSKDVSVNLSDKNIDLMFANPATSTADMALQLVIKDTVIMHIVCIHICIFIKCYFLSADLFQPVKSPEDTSLNGCVIFLILCKLPAKLTTMDIS